MPAFRSALDGHHPNRVSIEDPRCLRVVAQFGRIASHEENVVNAAGGTGQQIRLHADQIPIARAEVQDRLNAHFALDVSPP